MKKWITLLAVSAMVTACSKQELSNNTLQDESQRSSAMRSSQEGAYVSEWEQYNDWSKTNEGDKSRFSVVRKTPEINAGITNGGLVLTYAKVAVTDPRYASFANPTLMPFYYLPDAERPYPYTYYFSDAVSEGNVIITYSVPFTKEAMPLMGGGASLQSFQFQYVVLTGAFLDSRGLDPQTVRNYYTYDQVMNLVGPQ